MKQSMYMACTQHCWHLLFNKKKNHRVKEGDHVRRRRGDYVEHLEREPNQSGHVDFERERCLHFASNCNEYFLLEILIVVGSRFN